MSFFRWKKHLTHKLLLNDYFLIKKLECIARFKIIKIKYYDYHSNILKVININWFRLQILGYNLFIFFFFYYKVGNCIVTIIILLS